MKTTEPVEFRLEPADWTRHGEALYAVRRVVFVEEQQVPEELERDEHDPVSRHVLARDREGRAIATGRLLPDGHIGRLAVLRHWRGRGVGRAVLLRLMDLAREQGMDRVELNAQTQALAFYQALGFQAHGEEFMEAGIPHRAMVQGLERVIDGLDDARRQVTALIHRAWRSLHVYMPEVDPRLWDHPELVDALGTRISTQPRLRITLLLPQGRLWRRDCPRLTHRVQSLKTALELRTLTAEALHERAEFAQGFVIANQENLLHLTEPATLRGRYYPSAPVLTRDLLGFFAEAWEKGTPDPELQDLRI